MENCARKSGVLQEVSCFKYICFPEFGLYYLRENVATAEPF